jgi:hypothetical protein
VTYEELLELTERVCEARGSEHELSYWLDVLEANIPEGRITDLIYEPEDYVGCGGEAVNMPPKDILDKALAAPKRRAIQLGPSTEEPPN